MEQSQLRRQIWDIAWRIAGQRHQGFGSSLYGIAKQSEAAEKVIEDIIEECDAPQPVGDFIRTKNAQTPLTVEQLERLTYIVKTLKRWEQEQNVEATV